MVRKRQQPVYSTRDAQEMRCERCGSYPCRCPTRRSLPPEQQEAHIRREKKGRGGKTVTVVSHLELTADDLKQLGKQLKHACGTGGTVKEDVIEIQGDFREQVAAALKALGYRTKFTGG
ncbi:MAG: translation initiation factor [Anaerolineae bacterium]|nr:translation initiation factor [Anaerolineae bacterium]